MTRLASPTRLLLAAAALAAACGGGSSSDSGPTPPPPRPWLFEFATNAADGTVSTLLVDGTNGSVRHRSYALAGTSPGAAVTDAGSAHLYVANGGSASLSAFTIGALDGKLTRLDADDVTAGIQDFPTGANPLALALHPSGDFLYATLASNAVAGFAVDGTTGALTRLDLNGAVAGTDVATGTTPAAIAIDPAGRMAFVANRGAGTISVYAVDGTTGEVTRVDADGVTAGHQDFGAGTNPSALALNAAGTRLYAANSGSNSIGAWEISASTGALAPLLGQPFTTGANPSALALDPAGEHLYVANTGSDQVATFLVDSLGGLASMGYTGTADQPVALRFDPAGKWLHVATAGDHGLTAYAPGTNGVLDDVGATSDVRLRGPAGGLASTAPIQRTWLPKLAFFPGADVREYAVDGATGGLSFVLSIASSGRGTSYGLSTDAAGRRVCVAYYDLGLVCWLLTPSSAYDVGSIAQTYLRATAFDPSGRFVYTVRDWSAGEIRAVEIGPEGGLAIVPGSPVATAGFPRDVEISPNGRFLYVPGDGELRAYAIAASTGALSPIQTLTTAATPADATQFLDVAIDPASAHLYLTTGFDGTVRRYAIGTDGTLAYEGSAFVTTLAVNAVAVDSTGQFVYAATNDAIHPFAVAADGTFTALADVALPADSTPYTLAFEPTGRFLYAGGKLQSVEVQYGFEIDRETGALAALAGSPFVFGGYGTAIALTAALE